MDAFEQIDFVPDYDLYQTQKEDNHHTVLDHGAI